VRSPAILQLALLLVAIVLGMSPWFSATVVARAMTAEWQLAGDDRSPALWLTLAVQLGFVVGSTISAVLLLADRWRPARLAAGSAALAAVATALLAVPGVQGLGSVALRLVVGMALAGVYPPGIKLAAGWTTVRRGTAIGALVGATTLGSAVPHLLALAVPESAWRRLVLLAAVCSLLGALLFATVIREGPYQGRSAPFDPRALSRVVSNRGVRLATLGYLGHMWELYAMWSTIGLFWQFVVNGRGGATWLAPVMGFASVAAGAVGCVMAGQWSDRIGRSRVTIAAMAVSGACALIIGPALHGPLFLLGAISIVWGVSIVADSAQFSAAVTEFAASDYVGTAVTVQTALGFLLTMVTIRLVPTWSAWWGWQWAYAPLALGPAAGILAMSRLLPLERARHDTSRRPRAE
jgi:MFS family permease